MTDENRPDVTAPATAALGPASPALSELPRSAVGIDFGGTGIKGGIVDLGSGELIGERFRLDTPNPSTPEAVAETIGRILDELVSRDEAPDAAELVIGITVPGIVIDNVVHAMGNIDPTWIDCDTVKLLSGLPGEVSTLNDADAAALAEVRYGAGAGQRGTIMMVTLGTGVGTAILHDGVLIPNSELGHTEFEGVVAEKKVSAAARERLGTPWNEYGEVLGRYLRYLWRIQPVSRFIIGGGISTRADDFLPQVTGVRADVVVAQHQKNAGIVGAALYAAEQRQLRTVRT